jgi:hypothetical protein
MATAPLATTVVPALFAAARDNGITAPDWPLGRPPHQCRLDEPRYLALLRDRATGTTFTEHAGQLTITCPNDSTVTLWAGQHAQTTRHASTGTFRYPGTTDGPAQHPRGATVFTRRGDFYSHGWLSSYNAIPR